MKKALLVDDDYIVRSYLKMLPSWEKAGFSADARDGEEALEILEQENIDLVVTDIAMPLMDGIQLIHAIRERYHNIYIIVLSCHDDFEYVKQAMRKGADEYVLKNTLEEESLYTLLSVALKNMQKQSVEKDTPKMAAKSTFFSDKYVFFHGVLAGTIKEQQWEKERKKAKVKGIYQNSAVIVMKLEEEFTEDLWEEVKKEQYCLQFLEKLTKEIEYILPEYEKDIIYIGNGFFCCFIDLSPIYKSSVMHQYITSMASAFYKLCKKEQKQYSIGVSNVCMGFESIRQAYQQARMMIKLCFYEEDGIAYYESGKTVGKTLPHEAEEMLQQIDFCKYRYDRKGFQKMGEQVLLTFQREFTENKIVFRWIQKLSQLCGCEEEEKQKERHNIKEISAVLQSIENHFFEKEKISISESVSNPVRIAGEYAANHFKEDIGLNDAAAVAGVNSSYLSYLFSQEMGIGFTVYLLNIRIEYAKKILVESNLKMREVSEKSGFHDYHYFSKVFKKTTGVSPAEYRKNQRNIL